jgi:hypothetical protein
MSLIPKAFALDSILARHSPSIHSHEGNRALSHTKYLESTHVFGDGYIQLALKKTL